MQIVYMLVGLLMSIPVFNIYEELKPNKKKAQTKDIDDQN